MILVDSSVWIDYFNGRATRQTDLLDVLLEQEPILMGDIILTEVLQGFRTEKDFRKAEQLLSGLPYFDMLGRELAIKSARNYRRLRRQGVTVRKTIDVMIATFCIEHDFQLLHDDRDFDAMADVLGLKVVKGGPPLRWISPFLICHACGTCP